MGFLLSREISRPNERSSAYHKIEGSAEQESGWKLQGQITDPCTLDIRMCPCARRQCMLFPAHSPCRLAVSILSSDVLSTAINIMT